MKLNGVDWCDLFIHSLQDVSKYILILGAPRSGLVYIRQVLLQLKLNITHEGIGGDGACGWPFVPAQINNPNITIFHQVRNPLKAISSMQTLSDESWEYIAHYLKMDLMKTDDLVFRGMQCWYHWNKLAEDKANYTYRVEDIENVWGTICELLKINRMVAFPVDVPTDINSRWEHYDPLEEEDLMLSNPTLAVRVLSLGRKYGYMEF